ncbi:hypothetical protein ACOME3_005019 [Neoechinorhynchus agilis]
MSNNRFWRGFLQSNPKSCLKHEYATTSLMSNQAMKTSENEAKKHISDSYTSATQKSLADYAEVVKTRESDLEKISTQYAQLSKEFQRDYEQYGKYKKFDISNYKRDKYSFNDLSVLNLEKILQQNRLESEQTLETYMRNCVEPRCMCKLKKLKIQADEYFIEVVQSKEDDNLKRYIADIGKGVKNNRDLCSIVTDIVAYASKDLSILIGRFEQWIKCGRCNFLTFVISNRRFTSLELSQEKPNLIKKSSVFEGKIHLKWTGWSNQDLFQMLTRILPILYLENLSLKIKTKLIFSKVSQFTEISSVFMGSEIFYLQKQLNDFVHICFMRLHLLIIK